MAAVAADPTIRRQVLAVARNILADDAAAPVSRIADAAGVSRATFYRHFGSRASLLAGIEFEPPPDARTRILLAAQGMLVTTSLDRLVMDELARASGVSRGTLYRLFPGKAALLRALIAEFSPFESIRAIIAAHPGEPPSVVLPLVARTVVGVAHGRMGLMRAVFHELTAAADPSLAAIRPIFRGTIGELAQYMQAQIELGRIRPMHPLLALQTFIGPVFFHLMTRPVVDEAVGLPMDVETAVDELVGAVLEGLMPR